MILYNINELKTGLKFIQDGEPCVILESASIQPGKGQSFSRVRFRQIVSGKILEKTFKSGDFLEWADVVDMNLMYIYRDRGFWYFMDEENFEEIAITTQVIGANEKWMKAQVYYIVTLWKSIPIQVTPPTCMELKIIQTTPIKKNNARSSGTKLAVVSTGAVIKVPLFIQIGELVKVNTRSGIYVSRTK